MMQMQTMKNEVKYFNLSDIIYNQKELLHTKYRTSQVINFRSKRKPE